MKKTLLAALLSGSMWGGLLAQEAPLWMRYCALSPDGKEVAFTYKGDIFTVPVTGGRALQLTTHPAFDSQPVWSPDSKRISFASDRMGSMDVYVVNRHGGVPTRLTTHSGTETPVAFLDSSHVLFTADILPGAESVQFPSNGQFKQVYQVSVEGGRPKLYSSLSMEEISINEQGVWLYQDKKGYEDPWRKHQVSPIARDVWMYRPAATPLYEKMTDFAGEDREPVWAPDGKSFYYLSEQSGTFNVYRRVIGEKSAQQITHHTKHPVRFLSVADNGLLCYGFDGEIYTMQPGQKPKKLEVQIVSDRNDQDLIRQIRRSGATEMAVSPGGKEVAFVLRGNVYVTSVDYKTTRQITDTPCQERNVNFSPDGRTLVYASERDGLWQLYTATIVRKDEKLFTYATDLKEERLTHSEAVSFQPQFSPDGKEVAFLENRTAIRVINLKTKAVRTVMEAKYQYSYSDGDQWFQWSPDSRWILADYIGVGGWNNKDVALLDASGRTPAVNLTESGYTDGQPKWVLGGKAMMWYSDRAGYRSHGSWGAERDAYLMFFDAEAYDRFRMTKEETECLEEAEKEEKKHQEKTEKTDKKKQKLSKDKEKEEAVKPLTFDLANRFDRIVRLTVNSSHLGDAVLTKKGDVLYYLTSFEKGYDLWEHNLKENSTKLLKKEVGYGELLPDKEGKNIFLCTGGQLKKIEVAGSKISPIEFEAFFDYRPYEERAYIFDHVGRQVNDKFYVPDLHGVDWKGYQEAYRRFLPHINNNYDFAEMLSEWLGELNASHTGARYAAPGAALSTATLGLFYDDTYAGGGLKILEIIAQSPLAQKKTKVTTGCIIEKMDGQSILAGMDYFPLLEGKVGRKMVLTVYDPATGQRFEEVVKPISQGAEKQLLYKRWVERCRQQVEEFSGGRIGYVHIEGMNSPSFRRVYSDLLSERNRQKDAVIVDVRHNGGGWLHDDVVTLLSGKEYERFAPRGQYIGSDPFNKWLKPSCMLICEDNYSNAHGTPFVYKTLQVGKLVGTPVAGTMTAVWWERQIDPSLVFGIPQVGCMDMQGHYLENQTLQPDVLIYNQPQEVLQGVDMQLKKAVETLK